LFVIDPLARGLSKLGKHALHQGFGDPTNVTGGFFSGHEPKSVGKVSSPPMEWSGGRISFDHYE
jgi:hypothetical protein